MIERTGDWEKTMNLVQHIQEEMVKAQQIALKRWGLFAERTAIMHISNQDLGWEPLKAGTVSAKVRAGYSENVLVRTSTYFQSITSYVKDDVSMAGVKKTATYKGGEEVANIAAVHEFGSDSANIPARPLWQPTFDETLKAIKTNKNFSPTEIFLKNIKKYT